MSPSVAGPGPASARTRAASGVCAENQWPAPQLVRAASGTAVYRSGDLALRVAAPGRFNLDAHQQNRLVELLNLDGIPVAAPVGPVRYTAEGDELTVSRWVEHHPGTPMPGHALGVALARLHHVGTDSVQAAVNAPLADSITKTLSDARRRLTTLREADHRLPASVLAQLASAVDAAGGSIDDTPHSLVHGDIHAGNLRWLYPTVGPAAVVLLDWEGAGRGPWWWDFAHLRRELATGELPESSWAELLTGYGCGAGDEPTTAPAWRPAVTLRSVNHVLWIWLEHLAGAADPAEAQAALDWFVDGMPGLP